MTTPYYIASFEQDSGLNTYYEPFLIPEKAFTTLEDAYCFRGKVRKRRGYALLGRLRRILTTAALGNFSAAGAGVVVYNIFTLLSLAATEPNAQIQPGSAIAPISIAIGGAIAQTLTDGTGTGTLTIAPPGVITAASLNYATGDLTLTFSGAVAASAATISMAYYPGLPVMGLRTQELKANNNEDMIAFDMKYAYKYNPATTQFEELASTAPTVWHGTNSDFFWSTNYYTATVAGAKQNLFWTVNNNMGVSPDPIRYYDTATWNTFSPAVTAANNLYNAEIVIPYKDRLLFLNTWEGTAIGTAINYPQRLRASWNGDPLNAAAFRDDMTGHGIYIDAPTSEVIVGAEFIKDTLIVKFERSSWKVVYTGNELLPFVFQKINTVLGAKSKFSLVPFDRGVFAVSSYGLTTDDSTDVQRIDIQIPDAIFNANNDDAGALRIHGIRDLANEMCYWTLPQTDSIVYPNKILAFNYRNNTYSIFNDSMTCFGYFQRKHDLTWAELTDFTWAEWDTPWSAGVFQSLFPSVVGGTQHGFVEILSQKTINDASLYIKAIDFTTDPITFTVPQNNLQPGDIVQINDVVGSGALPASNLNSSTYMVQVPNAGDPNTINLLYFDTTIKTFLNPLVTGLLDATSVYLGNGTLTKINNIKIATKVFAPYYNSAQQCRLHRVDFLFDRTVNGELKFDVFVNENNNISMTDPVLNPCVPGDGNVWTKPENAALVPMQVNQMKIWHRRFINTIVQNYQLFLSMSPAQNADLTIASSDVVLHAIAMYISSNSRLVQ
jgi:hypothetical protein